MDNATDSTGYSSLDRLRVVGLEVDCIIGTLPAERINPQTVIMDITLGLDLRHAGESDDLSASVDYAELCDDIIVNVQKSDFLLIERLAAMVVDICLSRTLVQVATVRLSKPDAIKQCKTVQVEITRCRK